MQFILFIACLLTALTSSASDFPANGWWTLPGVATVSGETIGLLQIERYEPPKLPPGLPGFEAPQAIREHPERAWRLTYFRVETQGGANHVRLDRESRLASIRDGTIICFGDAVESHYRYSVAPDGVSLEFIRKDVGSFPGFLHLFRPAPDGKFLCRPTTPEVLALLKQQVMRFFP